MALGCGPAIAVAGPAGPRRWSAALATACRAWARPGRQAGGGPGDGTTGGQRWLGPIRQNAQRPYGWLGRSAGLRSALPRGAWPGEARRRCRGRGGRGGGGVGGNAARRLRARTPCNVRTRRAGAAPAGGRWPVDRRVRPRGHGAGHDGLGDGVRAGREFCLGFPLFRVSVPLRWNSLLAMRRAPQTRPSSDRVWWAGGLHQWRRARTRTT